jgi:hypothetical protein
MPFGTRLNLKPFEVFEVHFPTESDIEVISGKFEVVMYAIANKYDVADLKRQALEEFGHNLNYLIGEMGKKMTEEEFEDFEECFVGNVREIYKCTSPGAELRTVGVMLIHRAMILLSQLRTNKRGSLQYLLNERPDLRRAVERLTRTAVSKHITKEDMDG